MFFNPRARKVYEKVGFVIDSIDETELEFEGEWIDSINMKLTRENWIRLHEIKGRTSKFRKSI